MSSSEVESNQPATPSLEPSPPIASDGIKKKVDWDALTPIDRATLAEEESELNKKLMLFGTDVSEIPCFRNSFLYGITGGIGVSIVHFGISSKVYNATRFGFWSYIAITSCYWCWCRYEYSSTKFQYAQLKYAMQRSIEAEGTSNSMPRQS